MPCEASRSCSSSEATPGDLRDAPSSARGTASAEKDKPSLVGYREIQPFDEGRVQFQRVLGVAQRLFESPRVADQHPSLDLDDAIVPSGLDHRAIQTRWSQNATDNSLVELESVSDDQGDTVKIHSAGYILKEGECVSVASSSY